MRLTRKARPFRPSAALAAVVSLLVASISASADDVFVRGDSNADRRLDVSDPVSTLAWLFLGGAELRCKDAADSNDDENLDLSDAVHALAYLFLGGPEPPAPFPPCGADPAGDALDCASFPGGDCGGAPVPDVRREIRVDIRLPELELASCDDPRGCAARMEGFDPFGAEGDPRLLTRTYHVLLPRHAVRGGLAVEIEEARTRTIDLPQDLRPASGLYAFDEESQSLLHAARAGGQALAGGRNPAVYQQDALFPASTLGGPSFQSYRGWRLLSLPVRPVQYNPVRRQLTVTQSLRLKVSAPVVPSSNLTAQSVLRSGVPWIQQLVEGGDLIKGDGMAEEYDISPEVPQPDGVDMLLITTQTILDDQLENGLYSFVQHKKYFGTKVKVWTVEDIYADFPVGTGSYRIREHLKHRHPQDLFDYVLLVGNPDQNAGEAQVLKADPGIVPMCDTANGNTDVYYSDLDEDWDTDGDGKLAKTWAETGYPDVVVSRIAPVGGYIDDIWVPGWDIEVHNDQMGIHQEVEGVKTLVTVSRQEKLRKVFEKIIRYDRQIDKSWRHQVVPIGSWMWRKQHLAGRNRAARLELLASWHGALAWPWVARHYSGGRQRQGQLQGKKPPAARARPGAPGRARVCGRRSRMSRRGWSRDRHGHVNSTQERPSGVGSSPQAGCGGGGLEP